MISIFTTLGPTFYCLRMIANTKPKELHNPKVSATAKELKIQIKLLSTQSIETYNKSYWHK
jgi:hypothetical protein